MSAKVVRVVNNIAPKGSVAIGRGTVWGNPFLIGADGDRDTVVRKFYQYALWRLEREPNWLEPLRGKDLACYCAPKGCHGDVILHLLEAWGTADDSASDQEEEQADEYDQYEEASNHFYRNYEGDN